MGATTPQIPPNFDPSPNAEPITLCSSNRCDTGHIWPARLRIAPCGGCGAQTLEIRMEMCPVCNEPASSTEVRTDWTRDGMRKVAACRGDQGGRDTGNVGAVEICHAQPSPPTAELLSGAGQAQTQEPQEFTD